MRKHRHRHVRVTYQVVWCAQRLLVAEAIDLNKGLAAVGNLPLEIGG